MIGLLLAALLQAAPPGKLPVPPDADRDAARDLVRQIFEDDYASRDPMQRRALAQKLLRQAGDPASAPATRYVLFTEAVDVAAGAGDAATVTAAVDALDEAFMLDPTPLLEDALSTAGRSARAPADLAALAQAYLASIDTAIRTDDYDAAHAFASKSASAARRARDAGLYEQAQARRKEVSALRTAFRPVKSSLGKLESDPDDPDANLVVGRFFCLVKQEWKAGLWMLAKGSDPVLRKLAETEMAGPETPDAMAALGDGWKAVGDRERSATMKPRLHGRALHWYEQAVAGVTGLDKLRLEREIETLTRTAVKSGGSVRRGLVFWVAPGTSGDPFADLAGRSRPVNRGVTVASDSGRPVLEFDGAEVEYPGTDAVKAIRETGSVFAWTKAPSYAYMGGIVNRGGSGERGDDFALWIRSGHYHAWWGYPNSTVRHTSTGGPTAGAWSHGGYTWTAKELKVYVDGKEDSVLPLTPAMLPPTSSTVINLGSNPPGGREHFRGLLGEVRIYDRALAPAEVARLHAEGRRRFR